MKTVNWVIEAQKLQTNNSKIAIPAKLLRSGEYKKIQDPEQLEGLVRVMMDHPEDVWNKSYYSETYHLPKLGLLEHALELTENMESESVLMEVENIRRVQYFNITKGRILRDESGRLKSHQVDPVEIEDMKKSSYESFMAAAEMEPYEFEDKNGFTNSITINHLYRAGQSSLEAAILLPGKLNAHMPHLETDILNSVDSAYETSIKKFESVLREYVENLEVVEGRNYFDRTKPSISVILREYSDAVCGYMKFSELTIYMADGRQDLVDGKKGFFTDRKESMGKLFDIFGVDARLQVQMNSDNVKHPYRAAS